ncbi:MAG: signal peptidase II [Syntrophus sp. (in: bacteria)]|nr:signal peptidase II [Syntrophus sp. (in: bacteria)]
MRRYSVFLIVPFIVILDRWTKTIITDGLTYLESIPVTSFFSIVYVKNFGGAFGFLSQNPIGKYVFTFFPLAVTAVLIYVIIAYKFPLLKTFSLACILAGAIGNIFDRISLGYVIDFLSFYYNTLQWPAFNVADMSISTGIGLWFLSELLIFLKKGDETTKSA